MYVFQNHSYNKNYNGNGKTDSVIKQCHETLLSLSYTLNDLWSIMMVKLTILKMKYDIHHSLWLDSHLTGSINLPPPSVHPAPTFGIPDAVGERRGTWGGRGGSPLPLPAVHPWQGPVLVWPGVRVSSCRQSLTLGTRGRIYYKCC